MFSSNIGRNAEYYSGFVFEIYTKEKRLICSRVSGDIVSIDMGKPKLDWKDIPLIEDPKNKKIQFCFFCFLDDW